MRSRVIPDRAINTAPHRRDRTDRFSITTTLGIVTAEEDEEKEEGKAYQKSLTATGYRLKVHI